jgi:hypothetical protein
MNRWVYFLFTELTDRHLKASTFTSKNLLIITVSVYFHFTQFTDNAWKFCNQNLYSNFIWRLLISHEAFTLILHKVFTFILHELKKLISLSLTLRWSSTSAIFWSIQSISPDKWQACLVTSTRWLTDKTRAVHLKVMYTYNYYITITWWVYT